MTPKPINRTVERFVMLTKTEARQMAWGALRGVVERADRNGGHAGLDRNVTAKVFVGAVETQWPKVGGHEVGAVRRQDVEADGGQGVRQTVALALHVGGETREIA